MSPAGKVGDRDDYLRKNRYSWIAGRFLARLRSLRAPYNRKKGVRSTSTQRSACALVTKEKVLTKAEKS